MLRSVYSKLEENQTDLNNKVVKLGSTGVDNYILAEQRKIIKSFAERTEEFTNDYKKQLERRTVQANKIISDIRNTEIKSLSVYEYGKMIGFYIVLILVILTLAKAIHFGPYEGLGFSWFMKQIEDIGWLYWTFQGVHVLFWIFIVYTLYRGFKSYSD